MSTFVVENNADIQYLPDRKRLNPYPANAENMVSS